VSTWGDAPMRIFRMSWIDCWAWECTHCHFGHNIPWEEVSTWPDAVAAVTVHIQRHRELGTTETWRYAL
jgi:hypothetical protein